MEQFRKLGEDLGSLKALMVLQEDIQFNQRQCCLLHDIFTLAFETIAQEIKDNLKLEEKNTKWKVIEQPLRQLHKVFKEGELYIKQCMDDSKNRWANLIILHQNRDCVEFHIHNLLCYFPAVIEAIENVGEISGLDRDDMQKRRLILSRKYDDQWNDPKLFQWRFGKQYLIPKEILDWIKTASKEDKWRLVEKLKEKTISQMGSSKNNEKRLLRDLMLKKLTGSSHGKLFPSSVLFGSNRYQMRRRLGDGNRFKEIQWFGEHFVLRNIVSENESIHSEVISPLLLLSHPNILQYLCGFYDEENNKKCFLVMELMNKDLRFFIKECFGPRRRTILSLPMVVDIMLQIARGMEYLHFHKIYHGELNPSNIFIKTDGYIQVKISGFGLSPVKDSNIRNDVVLNENQSDPFIWYYAPEVLGGHDDDQCKYTEKADVYSFGMICFELLTGNFSFKDGNNLEGKKSPGYNLRAGERPLFPFTSPKYLVNLTRKCWQMNPCQRPSFSSICRILRYVKKFLTMNPENTDNPLLENPCLDFCDIEEMFSKTLSSNGYNCNLSSISGIPYEMFSYRLAEMGKNWNLSSKDMIPFGIDDDNVSMAEDALYMPGIETRSVCFDMRSICSDMAVKKAQKAKSDTRSICSDMKSIYSETPFRKVMKAKSDTRSICSDTKSIYSETPFRKVMKAKSDTRSICSDVRSVCSETSFQKTVSPKSDSRLIWSEINSGKKVKDGQSCEYTRSICSEIPVKKSLRTKKCRDMKMRNGTGKVEAKSPKSAPNTPGRYMRINGGSPSPLKMSSMSRGKYPVSRKKPGPVSQADTH